MQSGKETYLTSSALNHFHTDYFEHVLSKKIKRRSNSAVEAQMLTTWHIFWNAIPTICFNYNTYAKVSLFQRQDYHQHLCSLQKSAKMIHGKLFISLFHSIVWIHAPVLSHYPKIYSSFASSLLQYSNLYLPPLYVQWWLKASQFPSSIFKNTSPVTDLLQHTSIWTLNSPLLPKELFHSNLDVLKAVQIRPDAY